MSPNSQTTKNGWIRPYANLLSIVEELKAKVKHNFFQVVI